MLFAQQFLAKCPARVHSLRSVEMMKEDVMAEEWDLTGFKVEELLAMAVVLEQKGYDFYSAFIEKSPERRVKNEVRFLREEEARHKALFQEMLKKKGKSVSSKPGAGLEKMLQHDIVVPLEQLLASDAISSSHDALSFGAAMEKKSIDLYKALSALPGAEPIARDIMAIIAEEEGHIHKLSEMMAF